MWEGPQCPESEPDWHYRRAETAPTLQKKSARGNLVPQAL